MCLHGCLVERRLAVEENNVAVDEMAVHDIALTELDTLRIHLTQVDRAILTRELYRLCTRMLIRTIANLFHKALAILERHTLGECEIGGNLRRNAEFVELNVGVRCDNGTGREVNALAHKVAANTTLLGSQTRLEGTQRTTRTLNCRVQALDVVVHLGRHILLKEHRALRENLGRLTLVHLIAKAVVGTNNHQQLVRQIVFHALIVVHDDRRTDTERRNCKNRADHPIRTRKLRIKSECAALLVGQALEGTMNNLRLERDGFTLLSLSLQSSCRSLHLGDVLEELGLAFVAEAVLGADLRVTRTNRTAIQADLVGELVNHIVELNELHRARHANVSEMPRALQVRVTASRTDLSILGGTKAGIKDAARNWLISLIVFVSGDLDDALLENIVGAPDAELDANDLVAHLTAVLFLSFRRFVFAAPVRTAECPNRS